MNEKFSNPGENKEIRKNDSEKIAEEAISAVNSESITPEKLNQLKDSANKTAESKIEEIKKIIGSEPGGEKGKESKEVILGLMAKKLNAMIKELESKSWVSRKMIGEDVLKQKISQVKMFLAKVEGGAPVDLITIKDKIKFVENVDVEYLDDAKTIETPENENKKTSANSHSFGGGA